MESENKKCQNCKDNFVIETEDLSFYKKVDVPIPTWCPRCRFIRRAIFRNEHYLFKKNDFKTGKEIFSAYPKDSLTRIYEHDFWWSDHWDPMKYGFTYDFSRNFFEQFHYLQNMIPWCSRAISNSINSDYCNNVSDLKDCYMVFSLVSGINSLYGVGVSNVKDSIDFYHLKDSTLCYETFSVIDSYKVFYSIECAGCSDLWFCKNCRNCSDCFGCVNLSNKKYCFFNEQYSKEEYQKKIGEFNSGSHSILLNIKKKVKEFQKNFPVKFMHTMKSQNSSGDNIYGSNNAKQSFHIYKSENVKFSQNIYNTKDSYDYSVSGWGSELMYECVTCGGSSNLKFCFECWPVSGNLEYCMSCYSCTDCFGCVGLNKKQYCIFNKQYSKEEYQGLILKIKQHMNDMPYIDKKGRCYKYGEFFPLEFSPFTYNESLAFDYLPLSKKDTVSSGYDWRDFSKRDYNIEIQPDSLPDNISDLKGEILNKTIGCTHSGVCECNCSTAFRIVEEELRFYKRFSLPIPRLCPNCRFTERIKQLNPMRFYNHKCDCIGSYSLNNIYKNTSLHDHTTAPCLNEFETSYFPNDDIIIYCEKCYQSEIF